MLRTSKFPRRKLLLPKDYYGGVKFNSKSLKIVFYNKLDEMSFRESQFAKDLLSLGIDKNRILRAEIQIKGKYGVETMLKRLRYSENDNTFKKIFSLEKFKETFCYVFGTLHKNMPAMTLQSPEEIANLYKNDSKKLKVLTLLNLQKDRSYMEAMREAQKLFSKYFIKTHNRFLIDRENLRFIIPKFMQEIENYVPLTHLVLHDNLV